MIVSENYEYIKELQEEKVPAAEKEIKELKDEIEPLQIKKRNWRRLGIPPHPFNPHHCTNILSWLFVREDEELINEIYRVLDDNDVSKPLIDSLTFNLIDCILCVVFTVITTAFVKSPEGIAGFAKLLDFLGKVLIGIAAEKILLQIWFIWYFVIRQRARVIRKWNKQIRQLRSKINILQSQVDMHNGLIEQYKIATLNTEKEVANLKAVTINKLNQIISDTRKDILPSISNTKLRERYNEILAKCDKLLSTASYNGSIVSEVSQIFNAYIPEINSIILLFGNNTDKISDVLDHLERHIDDKIRASSKIEQFELESRIGALKSSISSYSEGGKEKL